MMDSHPKFMFFGLIDDMGDEMNRLRRNMAASANLHKKAMQKLRIATGKFNTFDPATWPTNEKELPDTLVLSWMCKHWASSELNKQRPELTIDEIDDYTSNRAIQTHPHLILRCFTFEDVCNRVEEWLQHNPSSLCTVCLQELINVQDCDVNKVTHEIILCCKDLRSCDISTLCATSEQEKQFLDELLLMQIVEEGEHYLHLFHMALDYMILY